MLSIKATVDVGASVNKNIHDGFDRLWHSPTQSAHVRSMIVSLARPTVEHLQFASARLADDRRPVFPLDTLHTIRQALRQALNTYWKVLSASRTRIN